MPLILQFDNSIIIYNSCLLNNWVDLLASNNVILCVLGTPGDWSHIIKQIGMFTFTGLNAEQVAFMTKEYHIYMTSDG